MMTVLGPVIIITALLLLYLKGKLATSCHTRVSHLPSSAPTRGQQGIAIYCNLIHDYLSAFFQAYEQSLVKGHFGPAQLQGMIKCTRKVETYMHELDFRRANDLRASERHSAATLTLMRCMEAYIVDAADRTGLPYAPRLL